MIRALAVKELRETAWISILAAGWLFVVVLDAMRMPLLPLVVRQWTFMANETLVQIPFVGGQIANGIGLGMALFAIALGIRQSAAEMWAGTYPLTLHLPMQRRRLFGVKIAVGIALVWGLGAAALGTLCLWAATPGTHASPFEWGMTTAAWEVWFAMPILYLGAFATGLLPARWFGTRLFPLATAGVTTLALLSAAAGDLPPLAFVAVVALAIVVFRFVIGHLIAVRDFS